MLSLQTLCVASLVQKAPPEDKVKELPPVIRMVILNEIRRYDWFSSTMELVEKVISNNEIPLLDVSNTQSLTEEVVSCLGRSSGVVQKLNVSNTSAQIRQQAWRRLADSMMASLSSLDMSSCGSRGVLASFASRCHGLRSVSCNACTTVTDAEVATILQKGHQLQELTVRRCAQLTDKAFIRGLQQRRYLLRLDLRECPQLTDRTLQCVARRCPTLLSLSVEGQRFRHGLTAVLNQCRELHHLAMPLCHVDEEALLLVRNTSCRVRVLDLFGSLISENTLLFLFGNVFRQLHRLNASGVRHLTHNVMRYVCQRNPSLQSLSLKGHIANLTDDYLQCISQCLSQLHTLDLGLCRAISRKQLEAVLSNLPCSMRELGLVSVPQIKDSTLKIVAQRSGRTLEKVSLGGCVNITDESIRDLVENGCQSLRSLCLKGTSVESTQLLLQLLKKNPSLTMLSLSGVAACNDQLVVEVAQSCPLLEELYISGTKVSDAAVKAFKKINPTCQVYGKRRHISS